MRHNLKFKTVQFTTTTTFQSFLPQFFPCRFFAPVCANSILMLQFTKLPTTKYQFTFHNRHTLNYSASMSIFHVNQSIVSLASSWGIYSCTSEYLFIKYIPENKHPHQCQYSVTKRSLSSKQEKQQKGALFHHMRSHLALLCVILTNYLPFKQISAALHHSLPHNVHSISSKLDHG